MNDSRTEVDSTVDTTPFRKQCVINDGKELSVHSTKQNGGTPLNDTSDEFDDNDNLCNIEEN